MKIKYSFYYYQNNKTTESIEGKTLNNKRVNHNIIVKVFDFNIFLRLFFLNKNAYKNNIENCQENIIKNTKKENKNKKLYNKNIISNSLGKIKYINKLSLLLIYKIILFNFTISVFSQYNKKYYKININSLNEVKIKIIGTGTQQILSQSFEYHPNEVFIDEIPIDFDSNNNAINNLENEQNTITIKWNYNLPNFRYMFKELNNLIEVDLSKLDCSGISEMSMMFYDCTNLKYINFNIFDTSLVTNMGNMFFGCESLEYLDLSKFNTSLVTNMGSMFAYCSSLKSIDLSSFNTSKVTNMGSMFSYCISLKSLDLSNFDTSLVSNMALLFYNCSSLTSLDISNFNTSLTWNMNYLFSACKKLKYIDISNLNTSLVTYMYNFFLIVII